MVLLHRVGEVAGDVEVAIRAERDRTGIEESRLESGELLLTYPVTIRPWLAGLFRRLGAKSERTVLKKLQLDPLGTEVWELMDGNARVRDIIRRFASVHHLPQREAEVAVTRFLWDLGKRGLVGLR